MSSPDSSRILALRGFLRITVLVLAFTASYWLAFVVRTDFVLTDEGATLLWRTLPWVLTIKVAVAYALQGFHGWMRYVSFFDLVHLFKAATVSTVALILADLFLLAEAQIPASVLVLDYLFTILLLGGLRSAGRFKQE